MICENAYLLFGLYHESQNLEPYFPISPFGDG